MALTAKIDTSKTPAELIVVSDKRERPVKVTVEVAGETATAVGAFSPLPVSIVEASGVGAIATKSDDGRTYVATVAAPS